MIDQELTNLRGAKAAMEHLEGYAAETFGLTNLFAFMPSVNGRIGLLKHILDTARKQYAAQETAKAEALRKLDQARAYYEGARAHLLRVEEEARAFGINVASIVPHPVEEIEEGREEYEGGRYDDLDYHAGLTAERRAEHVQGMRDAWDSAAIDEVPF